MALAQPAWPDPDWATSTPEAQGMDSRALAALVEYGGNARMDSLVVVRNGRLVTEAYYAPFRAGMRHGRRVEITQVDQFGRKHTLAGEQVD